MTVTATPYGKFIMGLALADFDFSSATLKVMLTTSSYTPNVDTHEFKSDVTNEITGTGYSAGGVTLTTVAWTYDSTNNWGLLTADPATWTAATFTTRYAVIYKSTGTDSTSRLIGYIDYGTNQSPVGEDFVINWTSGVVRVRPYTP